MESPAGMLREPLADLRVLMSGIVVNDRMDRLPLGNVCVDVIDVSELFGNQWVLSPGGAG